MPLLPERELADAVDLCLPDGQLNPDAVGWSRAPLHTCNLNPATERKKRWNYWCVTDDRVLFSATVADLDIATLAFAYAYDRTDHAFAEKTVILPAGAVDLPATPRGDITFEHPDMTVALLDDGAGTRIRVDAVSLGGAALSADVRVARPAGHETLNVVIPWSAGQFQFTSKQNTLPAAGSIRWGDRRYELSGPNAFGCLDYGRGIWPHETLWNWGAASGAQDGHVVGLNLGGRWTDGTGMTENALCVDGRLTKLSEDLRFEYDRGNLMRPWRITSALTDRVDLRFDPQYERISKAENETYLSEVHQLFGTYRGRITPDGGSPIAIASLFGWIEDHAARW